jgi:hypothetical protein
MRFATSRSASILGGLVLALLALPFFGSSAGAQGEPPGIDHYLVYRTSFVPGPFDVVLRDQWTDPTTHIADQLDWWANPVMKDNGPIHNSPLHYTWWRINPTPHSRDVRITNQFGENLIHVMDAHYLLNPALKNLPAPQPLPDANHYKCYRAVGPAPPRTVLLQDQWGSFQAEVQQVEWFCNPTDKFFQGAAHPMVRPDAHLTCYRIQHTTPPPMDVPYFFQDQFRADQSTAFRPEFLCLPTFKHEIVPTVPQTWGSVKALYR